MPLGAALDSILRKWQPPGQQRRARRAGRYKWGVHCGKSPKRWSNLCFSRTENRAASGSLHTSSEYAFWWKLLLTYFKKHIFIKQEIFMWSSEIHLGTLFLKKMWICLTFIIRQLFLMTWKNIYMERVFDIRVPKSVCEPFCVHSLALRLCM